MFRQLQRQLQPSYTVDQFDYLFDIWHDGYTARRATEEEARMQALLRERDALSYQRETLPLTERTAVTDRIAAITQQIGAMLEPPRRPPLGGSVGILTNTLLVKCVCGFI